MKKANRKNKRDKHQRRQEEGSHRVVKEKFQEERKRKVVPLIAKSANQSLTIKAMWEKQLIMQSGFAGTGKTELACWWASKLWLEGKIDNIILTRPHQHLGADYGAVKGNDAEKLLPFCMSMLMKFKKYLGVGILKNNFKMDGFDTLFSEADGIQIVPVEKIQGLSFSNRTVIILDEAQNTTPAQMKSVTTRMEEGCQLLICGDPRQSAIGNNNGLNYLEKVLEKFDIEEAEVIHYTKEDNVRGGITGKLVRAYEEMSGNWQ